MISVSRLLCGGESFGDSLRYQRGAGSHANGAAAGTGPVVVWTCTRTCNLRCLHCYTASEACRYPDELSTEEARRMIRSLADFRVPVLLVSGGEPLVRPDIMELAEFAASLGIRVTFSTNGLLITPALVERMKQIGVGYVGISFDGVGKTHDMFRGREGAYQASLAAVRCCLEHGQKVGVRFTINRHNFREIDAVFDMIEREDIPRACFYHLVYTGRGAEMSEFDLTHDETRSVMDLIMRRTREFYDVGKRREILTVDNHADGVYIYLKLLEEDPARAEEAMTLLRRSGGNRTGIAIGCIDNQGNVLPDQFTRHHVLGNVREREFGEIWSDRSNQLMAGLKGRKPLLGGRCATCRWLDVCNGNFRARAEAVHSDFWAEDPACYLSEAEISTSPLIAPA
jgi:Fe-coproporphyrin III synthase